MTTKTAGNGSGYERMERDSYCTPAFVTEILPRFVQFEGTIWEPACGGFDMARVLRDRYPGCWVQCSDIHVGPDADHFGFSPAMLDFLSIKRAKQVDGRLNIVTNPPYGNRGKLGEAFLQHALTLTQPTKGKVAMLFPGDYDYAISRRKLFSDHPAFCGRIAVRKRIRWANLDRKKNGPKGWHAWFLWDWEHAPVKPPVCLYA